MFNRCLSIVRNRGSGDLWQYVEYLVFDAPYLDEDGTSGSGSGGGSGSSATAAPFEDRIEHVKTLLESRAQEQEQERTKAAASGSASQLLQGRARVVGMVACKSRKQLKEQLLEVEKGGGEGLMLRKPGSLYEHKRSKTLLKVKSFTDEEAEVIAHQGGRGRNAYRWCAHCTHCVPIVLHSLWIL
jgi:DNA ligase-1